MTDDNIIEFKPRVVQPVVKTDDQILDEAEANPPKTRVEYLTICKQVLDEEDYKELLCSIMDIDLYNKSDDEIKKITEKYFSFKL